MRSKNRKSSIVNHKSLTIGWLYPELMSTYGDRGNVIVLSERARLRGIHVELKRISIEESSKELKDCDIIFMGGAQDTQQEIVNEDLLKNKGKYLIEAIEKEIPSLFICGAYQFLGKYYKAADGTIIQGLGAFDLYTENPGSAFPRLIGNLIVKSIDPSLGQFLVGFENHGGRTFLADKNLLLAKVVKGYGNNGKDGTEGIYYKNSVGTYMHGPILPKNPELADNILRQALRVKYKKEIEFRTTDDTLEQKARAYIVKRYNLRV